MKHQPAAISITHKHLQTLIKQLFLFQSKSREHQYFISLIWKCFPVSTRQTKIVIHCWWRSMTRNLQTQEKWGACSVTETPPQQPCIGMDGWNKRTAQTWSIWRLFNNQFQMTRKLPNDRSQHNSKKLKLPNFLLLLKTASTETKVHRSDTELTLRKDWASLWIPDGEAVTNSQRSSHWCSKTDEWKCKSYCKRNKDENKKQLPPCKSMMSLYF